MKKLRCTIAALLLMVFLPSVTLAAPSEPFQELGSPDNELHSGEAQVAFFAGYACGGQSCYINQLIINGYNQYNSRTTWTSSWYSAPVYSIAQYNWWWKPNKHIGLQFHIQGYGWRSCSVSASSAKDSWMHITYSGNNRCTLTFSRHRW